MIIYSGEGPEGSKASAACHHQVAKERYPRVMYLLLLSVGRGKGAGCTAGVGGLGDPRGEVLPQVMTKSPGMAANLSLTPTVHHT